MSLGEGGAYSEILRMLLDAGASPFMQRTPPLLGRDGGMLDQEISGNVGFTALHYAVHTAWPKPSSRHGVWLHIERRPRGLLGSSLHTRLPSPDAAHMLHAAPHARAPHTPWPSRAPFASRASLVCTHVSLSCAF